ncbi:MAG: hypothetical protein D6812_00705 [Deltaproteobacteria bacterium]|nr:MAG: hypothetical protein D6812_00705 [Deltaproteobacteria bacterium]
MKGTALPAHGRDTPIRTVTVPSRPVDETAVVLRCGALLLLLVFLLPQFGRKVEDTQRMLLPYQDPFPRLSPHLWTIFNELRAALEEICALREEEGRWPTPQALSDAFISPFAPILFVEGERLTYTWSFFEQPGLWVYLGQSRDPARFPHLMLRLEVAASGADPRHLALIGTDPFHRRLADGTIIHYSLWYHTTLPLSPLLAAPPERLGWRQVVISE